MHINATLIGQIIAFLLLIWFVNKVLWVPFVSMMQARSKRIAEGLEAGERGRRELEFASKRCSGLLAEARQKAAGIVAQAEHSASQILDEARANARTESLRVMALAQAELDKDTHRAREALRAQVADLVVAGAEQILRREIDARDHADILARIRDAV